MTEHVLIENAGGVLAQILKRAQTPAPDVSKVD